MIDFFSKISDAHEVTDGVIVSNNKLKRKVDLNRIAHSIMMGKAYRNVNERADRLSKRTII